MMTNDFNLIPQRTRNKNFQSQKKNAAKTGQAKGKEKCSGCKKEKD
jgi:hypothetical protein